MTVEIDPAANQVYRDQVQNLNDYDFILQTELRDSRESIRKIAESNMGGSKPLFPVKPKLRKPASVQAEAQSRTK